MRSLGDPHNPRAVADRNAGIRLATQRHRARRWLTTSRPVTSGCRCEPTSQAFGCGSTACAPDSAPQVSAPRQEARAGCRSGNASPDLRAPGQHKHSKWVKSRFPVRPNPIGAHHHPETRAPARRHGHFGGNDSSPGGISPGNPIWPVCSISPNRRPILALACMACGGDMRTRPAQSSSPSPPPSLVQPSHNMPFTSPFKKRLR